MAHATKARWWSLLIAPQAEPRHVALRFAEPVGEKGAEARSDFTPARMGCR